MNPVVKALWVEALRSGEFTQGAGSLAAYDEAERLEHCCLGVLCELAKREGVNVDRVEPVPLATTSVEGLPIAFDHSTSLLPRVVRDWAGLSTDDGQLLEETRLVDDDGNLVDHDNQEVTEYSYSATLAELNDEGHNFAEIADIIEKYF